MSLTPLFDLLTEEGPPRQHYLTSTVYHYVADMIRSEEMRGGRVDELLRDALIALDESALQARNIYADHLLRCVAPLFIESPRC